MHAGAAHSRLAALFFRKSNAIVTRLLACLVAANEPAALAVSWAQTPEECRGEAQAETEGRVVVSRVVVSRVVCQDSSVRAGPPPDSPYFSGVLSIFLYFFSSGAFLFPNYSFFLLPGLFGPLFGLPGGVFFFAEPFRVFFR